MASDRWVEIEVEEIKVETIDAYLCVIDGEEVWIPKSQMRHPDDFAAGETEVGMEVRRWIADQKGLL